MISKSLHKIGLLLALLVGFSSRTGAQTNIANYSFAVSSGTYTPITGTDLFTATFDDNVSAALTLPATFTFGGVGYTTCYVNSNGYLTFGTAASSSSNYSALSSNQTGVNGAVAAYAKDGANSTATGATPSVSYATVGSEFIVQWTDHASYSGGKTAERLNFQIRLNTANGAINIVYGSWSAPLTTATAQIGIRGSTTTWATNVNALQIANIPTGTTCDWSNAVTGNANSSTMLFSTANTAVKPANGLTYTWTPQTAPAPVQTFAAVSGITTTGATISWTASAGATSYNVQYRVPGTCTWTSAGNVATNSIPLSGLIANTSYQVRVQASNGSTTSIWSHIPTSAAGTALNGYTTTGTFTTLGNPCTTPTAQPTALTFAANTSTSTPGTFTAPATTPTNYLVVRSVLGAVPTAPVDGTSYTVGAATLGANTYIVSTGSTATITSTSLTSNTSYNYYIYSFNSAGCTGGPKYLATSPLTGTAVTCPAAPTAITTSNLSTSGFDLAWTAPAAGGGASPITYTVQVSTNATFAPGFDATGSPFSTSGTTQSITGLTGGTTYYYRVGAVGACTTYATSGSIATSCTPVTAYFQNFDAVTTPALPSCFSKVGTGGIANTQNTNANSAPNTLYLYSTSTSSQAVVSLPPVSNAGAGTYQLRFSLRANVTVGDAIQVGYLTNPTNAASFVLIQEVVASSLTYTSFTVAPGTAPGANQVLALRGKGSVAASMLVDDIYWEPIPSCLAPTAVATSNLTPTSADISWTASASSPIGYEYEVRTSGAAGSGATGLAASGAVTSPAVMASLSGLTAQTGYTVYVRSDCGSSSFSAWTAGTAFTTPCNATSIPYTEGFEGLTTAGTLPACMSSNPAVSTSGKTRTYIAAATSTNIALTARTGNAFSAVYYSPNAAGYFFSAPLQLTGGQSYTASVWFSTDATAWPSAGLKWGSAATVAGMTGAIATVTSAVSNGAYTQITGTFTPSTTGVYYVSYFADNTTTNAPNYMSFDDFSVDLTPACLAPTAVAASNVTATSADINWTASTTSPVGYEYEVRTSGAAGSGATGLAASGTVTSPAVMASVTSLTAQTGYTIYVRSNCGSSFSAWTAGNAFTTLCNNVTLTLIEGFNTSGTTVNPSCWSQQFISGSLTAKYVTTTAGTSPTVSTPFEGTRMVFYNSYSNSTSTRLVSPPITTTGVPSVDVNFQWYFSTNGGPTSYLTEGVTLQWSADGTTWNDFTGNFTRRYGAATGWAPVTATLPSGAGNLSTMYIGLKFTGNGGYDSYLDAFSAYSTPVCGTPTAVTATSITATGGNINWTAPIIGTPAGYEYEVRTSGAAGSGASGLTTNGSVAAPATSASLSGLMANTSYSVYVRSDCGSSSFSAWTAGTAFTTPCNASSIPYTEGFEGLTTAGTLPACMSSNPAVSTSGKTRTYIAAATSTNIALTARTGNAFSAVYYSPNAAGYFFSAPLQLTGGQSYTASVWFSTDATAWPSAGLKWGSAATVAGMTGAIATVTSAVSNGAYTQITGTFTPATTGVYYVSYFADNTTTNAPNYMSFDDFSVDLTPACLAPTAVAASNVTATSADINWTASTTSPIGYQYEVRTSGAAGSGTTGLAASGAVTSPAVMASVTSLTAQTGYAIYVRSDCGSSFSAWTAGTAFTTPCNAVTSFYENFDGITAPAFPACFFKVGNSLGSASTQNTNAQSSPNTLYIYAGTTSSQPVVALQPVSNAGAGTHQLRFSLRGNFTAGDTLQVGYLTNPSDATTFTVLQQVRAASLTYASYTVMPGTAPGTNTVLALRAKGTSGASMLIDDIYWEPIPSCLPPTAIVATNLTPTTADISWTASTTSPVGYQYEVRTSGAAGSGTTGLAASGAVTSPAVMASVTGLTTQTTYSLYVRSDCGASSFSTWNGPVVFSTSVVNDNATGAIALTVGAGCTGAAYSNVGATQGTTEPVATCDATAAVNGGHSVWFKFTAPSNGAVRISTDLGSGNTMDDSRIALFSATTVSNYGTFNIISCDEDGGSAQTFMSVLYATNLTASQTYYIQLDGYSTADTGTFCIAVDALDSTMLSANSCSSTYQTPYGSQGNGTYTGWVPLLDDQSKLVAMVRNPAGGAVQNYTPAQSINTATVRSATFDNVAQMYLNRNYRINNSAATNVQVRFFFLNAELAALQAADSTVTLGKLNVTRQVGTSCQPDFIAGTGANTHLFQTGNGRSNGVCWVDATTPAFSNFYLHKSSAVVSDTVFLQGPASGSTMTAALQNYSGTNTDLLPTTDPYGLSTVYSNINNVAGIAGPVVDWVKVEIRNATDAVTLGTIVQSRALLLKPNGTIVDPATGTAPLFDAYPYPVRMVVKHRNHLAIMSNTVTGFVGPVSYDFTTALSKAANDFSDPDQMVQVGSKWCMWAGDVNQDGFIESSDATSVFTNADLSLSDVYDPTDINFDGFVESADATLQVTNANLSLISTLINY